MAFSFQYISEGIAHITDPGGYDHMLFLVALCASYQWSQWRQVLWLVTAFTLGHSCTLVLAGLDIIRFSSDLVELLIPCTIALTAVYNLFITSKGKVGKMIYWLAAGFGLIHGMGFSSYFRMITSTATDMITSLLAFNIGVEIGQLIIVTAILSVGWLVLHFSKMKEKMWKISLSLIALVVSMYLIVSQI